MYRTCMLTHSCETKCLVSPQPQTSCWATVWCWSVQHCMPCPTCARSTRWKTWAESSSSAWWACLAQSSAPYRCESVIFLFLFTWIVFSLFLLFAVVLVKVTGGAQRSCCHSVELASWWVVKTKNLIKIRNLKISNIKDRTHDYVIDVHVLCDVLVPSHCLLFWVGRH